MYTGIYTIVCLLYTVLYCGTCHLAGAFPPQQSSALAPLASQASGQSLLAAMAQTVGARCGASQELLGHFVRAGGGDVGKAASLYLAMADEFVELRAMARYCLLYGHSPDNLC